jgi:hypothetical protein
MPAHGEPVSSIDPAVISMRGHKIPELTETESDDLNRLKKRREKSVTAQKMSESESSATRSLFVIQFVTSKHDLCKFAHSEPNTIDILLHEVLIFRPKSWITGSSF